MIPDFKTYIGESIWRNISQRSEGITSRKEDKDNINSYDVEELLDYILDNYDTENNIYLPYEMDGIIDVPVIYKKGKSSFFDETYDLTYDYNKKIITLNSGEIGEQLDGDFKVYVEDEVTTTIEPKAGEKDDNEFFIKVLNYIIKKTPSLNGYCMRLIKKKI